MSSFFHKWMIPSKDLARGEFLQKNSILLGFSKDGKRSYSIKGLIQSDKAIFLLFIRNLDIATLEISYPIAQYRLFDEKSPIPSCSRCFNFTIIELSNSDPFLIVTGHCPSDDSNFVYFTIIFRNGVTKHVSVPTNSQSFKWNPDSSLIIPSNNNLVIGINCISSIKLVKVFSSPQKIVLNQLNIDNYLSKQLQSYMRTLQYYETDIIGTEHDSKGSDIFIIFIGYYYFNDKDDQWIVVCNILALPIDDRGKTLLYSCFQNYDKHSQNFKKIIKKWHDEYQLLCKNPQNKKDNYHLMTNCSNHQENQRIIPIPNLSSIEIIDPRDNSFEFQE